MGTEYISKCTHGIVTEQVAMNTSSTDSTLLDQLKTFQSESFEWEKAAEYLSESLQQIAQSEVSRIAQSLDEDGRLRRKPVHGRQQREHYLSFGDKAKWGHIV